jgi:hypothetical protein
VVAVSLTSVVWAILVTAFFALPLALSLWALLDAARRPQWAWALAERSQVVWMAGILFAALLVPIGLAVSLWYLLRIRPEVAAAERGELPSR